MEILWTQYSPLLFHFNRIRPTTEKNSQHQLIIKNLMTKSMLHSNPKCYHHFHKIWQTIWFIVSSSFFENLYYPLISVYVSKLTNSLLLGTSECAN
jgi:hypothetical protein